jgi:glycosyltransferase involved in cell wall biosynthesis
MCYPDGYAALRLSSRWRVPFIITVRGSDLLTIKNFPQVKKKYDEILTKSSKVILPSFRIAEQFSDFYLDTLDAKIEVIPNGIEPSEFSDLKAVEFPYLKGKKVIVSVSNLYKDKGIDINLRALSVLVKQHKDIHYLIIGDGQERANLVKLMTDLKLEEYVTFVGRVNHHSALEYIKSCDIFSLPGWNETFGLVYLEAMYLKKPIVATFNDGIDGTAIDGIHGFLTHKQNVNEVVNALNKLLCSEKLRTEMGTQGFQQVFSRYTWEKHAEKISKIYQEIKNGTKRI